MLATVDSRDYAGASVDKIVAAVRPLEPGGIIVMHDYAPNTTKAIPRIARVLERKKLCSGRIRSTTRDIRSAERQERLPRGRRQALSSGIPEMRHKLVTKSLWRG